ncbi:hypothetical protein ONE63_001970 [Megalurothrips usitatus]|uniref:Peptidase M3A/M3B catalytic domain-containing protein n=1 Tax=Megalurothrips usitatus TaxID=439358 RepID=A0AAV7XHA7_9NEOP|nr:hypothetical protein ONE63_001970 [Megalurothrips usitatus]
MALSLTCRRVLFNRRHPTFLQCRQSGYVVVLPDVPMHSEDNPLLRSDTFQDFSSLTARKCYDGIVRRSLDFESGFWRLEKHIKDKHEMTEVQLFQEYLCPLEELSRPLNNAYNVVKVLRQSTDIMTNEKYFKIANRAALALDNKYHSPLLYHSCKSALGRERTDLKDDQKRLLSKFTTYGKLNGLDLPDRQYNALIATRKETLHHQEVYINKLSHETRQYRYPISDPYMVKNFPPHLLREMSEGPDPTRGPWTVRYPNMVPFLKYCPDPLIRDKVWHSKVQFGLHDENTGVNGELDHIRYARFREAKILGYESYSDYALSSRMAGSVENTLNMLENLVQKARPAQAHELESLNKFAFQNGFHKPLALWDVAYWQREQLNKTYTFDDNDMNAYFPLETVLTGLLSLLRDLFGIEFRELNSVSTWHKDVRVYEVFDSSSKSPIAQIYLDPFTRTGKIDSDGNALTLRNRSLVGKEQIPQLALVFNFAPPGVGKPSLLSFNNVTDLFGKFGYALQVILSKSAYAEVAGTAFVELDAVDIPSHFLVHWAFNQLDKISGHYETGEKLPIDAVKKIETAKKHMAGFNLCNEIYRSRLDLEIFATDLGWKTIMEKLWPMYFAFPLDPLDHSPMSFNSIFADGSASYYADLWSRVIAADVFTAFQEVGLDNKEATKAVGGRFRDIYLAGHSDAAEKFRKFRGRDPSPDAFLLWLGLQKPLKPSQVK